MAMNGSCVLPVFAWAQEQEEDSRNTDDDGDDPMTLTQAIWVRRGDVDITTVPALSYFKNPCSDSGTT